MAKMQFDINKLFVTHVVGRWMCQWRRKQFESGVRGKFSETFTTLCEKLTEAVPIEIFVI